MSKLSITFLGATDSVTGSRTLLDDGDFSLIVDCGLYQGIRSLEELNWAKFPLDAKRLSGVVLTHAHLDHCGYLPALVRSGFRGPIYLTRYTADLAEIVLRDSAFLQMKAAVHEEDPSHHPILYDDGDVDETVKLFQVLPFNDEVELSDGIHLTFGRSGHILGSAFVEIAWSGSNLLFTSDMGRPNHRILVEPDKPSLSRFDVVVTESTYGDRTHEDQVADFVAAVREGISRGGTIVIPAFAVDRTEVILASLNDAMRKGVLPKVPIFVDSPMAVRSLRCYSEAIEALAPEIRKTFIEGLHGENIFAGGFIRRIESVEDSKSLNELEGANVIISASGMAMGGRVVHHLKNKLPDPRNTVLLVGFQAIGSRGLALQQGVDQIRIHGEMIPVRAHIASIECFSSHADQKELMDWLKAVAVPDTCYVVHGEQTASSAFASHLRNEMGWNAKVPTKMVRYEIA